MKESFPLPSSKPAEEGDESWLEEQFSKIETLEVAGRSLKVLDIHPR